MTLLKTEDRKTEDRKTDDRKTDDRKHVLENQITGSEK